MTARRIAPDYSFRFTTEDIRATYGSADAAFECGDYLNAAQMAPATSEQKGCALILGGLLEQGLATLDERAALSARARLCRAFALWSLDRQTEAQAALERIDDAELSEPIRKFASLLARDNVTVFITGAILSIFPEHHSQSFLDPVYKYGSITVKYVASQLTENAYDYAPSQPFDEFIASLPADEQPDLLFALSPQWLIAKDFHKVPLPKAIWCHDTDAFHYRNVDNYALYDVAICNCSQEHFELSQGTPGLFCAANMLLHPLATPFPEASPHREKHYDIIFTGSAMAPFHSEKSRFLFKLAELGDKFTVRVVEGHLPEQDYFSLISHAKFLPVVNRYAGSPSPRWRDALANGAFLLYPEGTFYGEIAPGCFPFHAETMVGDVRRHLASFAAGSEPNYDLSNIVPEINTRFAIHRKPREETYERLLKYALFMSLIWRGSPRSTDVRQRRLVWLTPAVDCGLFGTSHVRDQLDQIAAHIDADDLIDDIDYNNAAHLHAQMAFTFHESEQAGSWIASADHFFKEGLALFPNSLLLLFNEAHWSFFKPKADPASAARKFAYIIDNFDQLAFDPHGADVAFAYTLHERDAVFPCYEYADVATSELVLRHAPELAGLKRLSHSTRDIILSACHGYIGAAMLKADERVRGLERLRQAISLYPLGLPVLRLYLDALLEQFVEKDQIPRASAADLADAFIAVANVNPSILLTHVFVIVPVLADNGQRQAATEILAAWYQLANIVHSLRTDDEQRQMPRLAVLCSYRWLFPAELNTRIRAGLKAEPPILETLTQLEQRLVRIVKERKAAEASRDRWRERFGRLALRPPMQQAQMPGKTSVKDLLALVAGESSYAGFIQERIIFSNLARALAFWWTAPTSVRWLYFNKAYRMALRGEFRQVVLRIQHWSTHSKWSEGDALNPRSGTSWTALVAALNRWMRVFVRRQE